MVHKFDRCLRQGSRTKTLGHRKIKFLGHRKELLLTLKYCLINLILFDTKILFYLIKVCSIRVKYFIPKMTENGPENAKIKSSPFRQGLYGPFYPLPWYELYPVYAVCKTLIKSDIQSFYIGCLSDCLGTFHCSICKFGWSNFRRSGIRISCRERIWQNKKFRTCQVRFYSYILHSMICS